MGRFMDGEKFLCIDCFKDEKLRKWINENCEVEKCCVCNSNNKAISFSKISTLFDSVMDLYVQTDATEGEFLFDLIQEEWEVFSEKLIEKLGENKTDFLEEIMLCNIPYDEYNLEPDYKSFFERAPYFLLEDLDYRIEKLYSKDDCVWSLRSDSFWKVDIIETVFEDLSVNLHDEIFFRARKHVIYDENNEGNVNKKFSNADMGMPPTDEVKTGRINRTKDPVFYLASDMKTAIAEVRPSKGCAVAVSEVKFDREIRIVDVSIELVIDSPFLDDNINWKINIKHLLDRFYLDFSLPLDHMDKEELYRPTQLISQLIKESGFDGIKYKSAMGDGYNIALFSEDEVIISDPEYYFIDDVKYNKRKDTFASGDVYPEHHYDWLRNK